MNPKQKLLNKLKELEDLPDYWDGDYSASMYKEVVERVRGIIMYGEEKYLDLWNIWPNHNGTITVSLKFKSPDRLGAIHVGLHDYSWIVKHQEERLSEEDLTDWKMLVSVFNKISENFYV